MRTPRYLIAASCVLAGLPSASFAATPDMGTLSEANPRLEYTFPVAPLANASGLAETNYTCDATFPCDEYALTLDLPADYIERFPDAYVYVEAATSEPNLDIDLQVSDEAGNVVYNYRDNPPAQPALPMYPSGGVQKFIVQVVPGTPHTGGTASITLVPGEEASKGLLFAGGLGLNLLGVLAAAGLAGLRRRPR